MAGETRTASIEINNVRYDGLDADLARTIADEFKTLRNGLAQSKADEATYKAQLDAARKDLDNKSGEIEGLKTKITDLQDKLAQRMAGPAAAPGKEESPAAGAAPGKEAAAAAGAAPAKENPFAPKEGKEAVKEGDEDDPAAKAANAAKTKTDEADFISRFDERLRLLTLATKAGVQKADSMSNMEMKKAIITASAPNLKLDGMNADFIDGIIKGVGLDIKGTDLADTARTLVGLRTDGTGAPRAPLTNADALDAARAEYIKNLKGE